MAPVLLGRPAELAQLTAALAAVPAGPRALVVEGPPGIGKTTLWQAAVSAARQRGYQVLAARGSQAEARLPFAGLCDLLEGVVDEVLPQLAVPQRRALEVALGARRPRANPARPAGGLPGRTDHPRAGQRANPDDRGRRRPAVAGRGLGPGAGVRAAPAWRPAAGRGRHAPRRAARPAALGAGAGAAGGPAWAPVAWAVAGRRAGRAAARALPARPAATGAAAPAPAVRRQPVLRPGAGPGPAARRHPRPRRGAVPARLPGRPAPSPPFRAALPLPAAGAGRRGAGPAHRRAA
jgi:AAA ATPase domain